MARKPHSVKNSIEPIAPPVADPPVESVGAREFRARLKAICEAGKPVIITRGRRSVSVFLPVHLPWFNEPKVLEAARKKLLKDALRASEALRRY